MAGFTSLKKDAAIVMLAGALLAPVSPVLAQVFRLDRNFLCGASKIYVCTTCGGSTTVSL